MADEKLLTEYSCKAAKANEEQTLLSANIRRKKLEKPNGRLSKFLTKDTER